MLVHKAISSPASLPFFNYCVVATVAPPSYSGAAVVAVVLVVVVIVPLVLRLITGPNVCPASVDTLNTGSTVYFLNCSLM
jgi:hypothetical protein